MGFQCVVGVDGDRVINLFKQGQIVVRVAVEPAAV